MCLFAVVVDALCLDLGLYYVLNGYVNMVCVFVLLCFWMIGVGV